MIKRLVRRGLLRAGYDILKVPAPRVISPRPGPPPLEPYWPLPRAADGPDDEAIRAAFSEFPQWHYSYAFEGGLSFRSAHQNPGLETDNPVRPLQRFRHFMPYLVDAHGGSLKGKRVLDIACNSGFWSLQCGLLGAEVVGFDSRPELIEQASLLASITGIEGVEFRVLDFWSMNAATLGRFDIVLNLGILYHLPKPLEALELTRSMAHAHVLLDTAVLPSDELLIRLGWETPFDIRAATDEGIVALPTRSSVELMLRHARFSRWTEIPVRTSEIPVEYRTSRRASWLIEV